MPRRGSVPGRADNPLGARFREIERAIRRRKVPTAAVIRALGPSAGSDVVPEIAYGLLPDPGSDSEYSRADHTHGSPVFVAGDGGWDAIVDSTLPASDPDNRLFLGIGEALTYLGPTGLNLNRALVLVRPGTYTEAANWTSPVQVVLFGATGNPNAVEWRVATFSNLTTSAKWSAYNIFFSQSAVPASDCLGFDLFAYNCIFDHSGTATSFRWVSERVYTSNCVLSNGLRPMAANAVVHHELDVNGSSSTITLPTRFVAVGLRLASESGTWNVGTEADIDIIETTYTRVSSGGSVLLTIGGNATSAKRLKLRTDGSGVTVNLSGTQWQSVELNGPFRAITIPKSLRCRLSGSTHTLDLTGPATVDLDIKPGLSASPAIIRGDTVGGHLTADDFTASNGTILRLIAARYCTIGISGEGSATGGTQKLYDIDASSVGNTLIQSGASTFPAASVNNGGATNRILPEGSAAFTTDGHVIEDEGTPLTQRANLNFAGAGVTVTDSAPDTLVTIPGAGTPTAGWGSITNVTTDRVYDANVTTIDELADVLGTLIADLIAQGILAT